MEGFYTLASITQARSNLVHQPFHGVTETASGSAGASVTNG